jgi:D-3-phosphoglycerate dehydrogenase
LCLGGSTEEAQVGIGREVSAKLCAYLNTGSSLGAVNFPEMSLPLNTKTHRILNLHQNVPGVLRDINNILAEYNVLAQMLMTNGPVGYLIVDVDREMSEEIRNKMQGIKTNIKTRLLF